MHSATSDDVSSTAPSVSNHGLLQLPSSLMLTSDGFDGRGVFSSSAFDRRKRDNEDDDSSTFEPVTSASAMLGQHQHQQEVQSILQKTLLDESLLHLLEQGNISSIATGPAPLSRHSSTGSRSSISRSGAAAQRRLQMAISSTTARMAELGAGEKEALSAISRSFQEDEEDEEDYVDSKHLRTALSEALDEAFGSLPKQAHVTRPRALSDKDRRERLQSTIHSLTREMLDARLQEYQHICNVARSRPSFEEQGGLTSDEDLATAGDEESGPALKKSASVTYTTQSSSPASASPSLPLSRRESSLVDEEEESPSGGLFLEQCAQEGISTAEADAARVLCERLEEYHWKRGHEREAEAAALAAGEIKKGGDDGPDGSHRRVQGDNNKNKAGQNHADVKGPSKITLPPSMAAKAQSLQDNLKKDTIDILRTAGGDPTNPRFASSLKVLSSIYKGRGYDARNVSSEENDGAQDQVSSTIEGRWNLISKPTYPDCLGRNDDGEFMYTLARMSFSMLSPGDVVCSVQSLRHDISLVALDDNEKLPDAVPRKLRDALENGPYRNGLRKYDIVVYITIEPQAVEDGPEADGQDIMPQSKLHAVMSNRGYMLPDSATENRFNVWFTGGSLSPAEGADMEAWADVFRKDRRENSQTFSDRAKVLATKLLLGAEIPQDIEADGSMSYRFHRPIPGHIDVVYTDESLQILRGNRGSVMVQSREGTNAPHIPKKNLHRRVSASCKNAKKAEARVA